MLYIVYNVINKGILFAVGLNMNWEQHPAHDVTVYRVEELGRFINVSTD